MDVNNALYTIILQGEGNERPYADKVQVLRSLTVRDNSWISLHILLYSGEVSLQEVDVTISLCVCVCVQIFMKYGRQRWKLRGRIEINAKQVWDSEEMIFLPLINEFLSVKVSLSMFSITSF